MKILDITNYDKMLFELIQNLRFFPSQKGSEGKAYFIDDKFIIKEFNNIDNEPAFEAIFDLYCKELKNFADEGYSVPKIYSWLKIPNPSHFAYADDVYESENLYYILEERVPGKEIYLGDIDECYNICSHLCSEEKFNDEMLFIKLTPLLKEIIKSYINAYIQANEQLEAMNESELENFILTLFNMTEKGIYSLPDIFRRNIITDGKQIRLIDNRTNHMKYRITENELGEPIINNIDFDSFYEDVISVFYENYLMQRACLLDLHPNRELKMLIYKNQRIVKEIILKVVDIINKRIKGYKISENQKSCLKRDISNIVGQLDAVEILEKM